MSARLSSYAFAATPAYVRRLMDGYAALFSAGPVVDLGCGRGYFLESVAARGIAAIGVDIDDEAAEIAEAAGHPFRRQDALEYLASARDLGGIFASHLIEHLDAPTATRMIALAAAALVPGGRLVVVTPNMADFRTLTETFWMDTTHVRPYPPKLIAAMMEREGLVIDQVGRGRTPQGRRAMPRVLLGRLRFGRDYGVTEVFVSARSPEGS
jgi:2-polyprenyl-3-methyl-5-hydroxy-6-metoxy-1,4-benzoquinol methylase